MLDNSGVPLVIFYFNSTNWAAKGKALWPTCCKCFSRTGFLILTVLAWLPVLWQLDKENQWALELFIMNS